MFLYPRSIFIVVYHPKLFKTFARKARLESNKYIIQNNSIANGTHLYYMGLLKAFHSYFHPVLDGVSTGMRSSRGKSPRIRDSIARISEALIVFNICISSGVRTRGSSFLLAPMYKRGSTCRKTSIAFFMHSNFLSISTSLFCRSCRWCRSHARSIVS